MFFKRARIEEREIQHPASPAEVNSAPRSEFEQHVLDRLAGIEQLLLHLKVKLDHPRRPEAELKRLQMSEIQTQLLRVRNVYDDRAGSSNKWNLICLDRAGNQLRIGTFDKIEADKAKLARANKTSIQVTFGKNRNGFYDLIGIKDTT